MYCYYGSSRTVSDSRVLGWPYLPQDAVALAIVTLSLRSNEGRFYKTARRIKLDMEYEYRTARAM